MTGRSTLTSLFQRAGNDDTTAQSELFSRYYNQAYRIAYSLLRHREDSEEVAQDSLHYALTQLTQFDPHKGAFTTWLYMIVASRCRNKRRRKRLAEIPLLSWLVQEKSQTTAPRNPLEHQFKIEEKYQSLYESLDKLPEKQREALILRYFHELNYKEISEIAGCSASTAQSRVWLGQKQIQKAMQLQGHLANDMLGRG